MASLVFKDYNGHDMPAYTNILRVGIPDADTGQLAIFADTSDATATANEIATGATAYVNGLKLTGTGKIGGIGTEYISIIGNSLRLSVSNYQWDGELRYSFDGLDWSLWQGEELKSATIIYLRGANNTTITNGNMNGRFVLSSSSKIIVLGNIENLLDYNTVSNGLHPTMAANAFLYLFMNCANLAVAPELKGNVLSNYCYANMFENCTSLLNVPILSATILATGCYRAMFRGCTKIMAACELPILTLAESCYESMFENCIALETVPNLPATLLAANCYYKMFKNCVMVLNISTITATVLMENCCREMFYGCTGLMLSTTQSELYTQTYRIPILGMGTNATNALTDMFTNTGGPFTGTPDINTPYYWYCIYVDANPGYLTFSSALNTDITIRMSSTSAGAKTWDGIIEYDDGSSAGWIEWNGESISGTKIRMRGINNTYLTTANNLNDGFHFTGTQILVSGYLDSLLDYTTMLNGNSPTMANYAFTGLFYGCTLLVKAPFFSRRALSQYCYSYMFYNCTSLTVAPKLPSLTLAAYCYLYMFGHTAITTMPLLPATVLAERCYLRMFNSCTNLTETTPLSAMTLAPSCYRTMFYGCTALTVAPELPAITLADYCYDEMFYNCTSLVTAPELPARTLTLYCYSCMFYGCTALAEAPELPATTLAVQCYSYMFQGCRALTSPPDLWAPTVPERAYLLMFYNCTSLEAMPIIAAATVGTYSCYQMFYGCTSLKTIAEFSMSSFGTYCFYEMFRGCTSLELLPEIEFKSSIPLYACYLMFYGCSKIKVSTIYSTASGYINSYKLPPWGTSSSTGTNAFYNMFASTSGTFKGTLNRNTVYYTSNTVVKSKAHTEIGVHLTSELSVPLYFTRAGNNLYIEWGDGSSNTTGSSATTITHTYTTAGDYTIKIKGVSGNWIAGRYASSKYYTLCHEVITDASAETEVFKDIAVPYVTSLLIGTDCLLFNTTYSAYLYMNLGGFTNLTGTVTVPGSMSYLPELTFLNCHHLTKIVLNEGVYRIDSGAFCNCTNLEEVVFPTSITTVGKRTVNASGTNISLLSSGMFSNTYELRKFEIPANVSLILDGTSISWGLANHTKLTTVSIKSLLPIENSMFKECTALTDVELTTTSIGDEAFSLCSALTSISIPSMTETISNTAFLDCPALSNFVVDLNNQYYSAESGILYNKLKTTLIRYPQVLTGLFTIPPTVTTINAYAFAHSNLTSIIVPDTVTTLGDHAFTYASITSISLSNNLTTLPANCFGRCLFLTSITIPNNITTIDTDCFDLCIALTSITIPNSVTSIGSSCFYGCTALTTVNLSTNITTLTSDLFSGCTSLSSIIIPDNVTTLASYVFRNTNINTINISAYVSSIDTYTFYDCTTLEAITVNANNAIYSAVDGVLYNKALTQLLWCPLQKTNLTMLDTTTSFVSHNAIANLTTITISDNLTISEILVNLYGDTLENINAKSTNTNYTSIDGILYNKTVTTLVKYPYRSSITLANSVTTIGNRAFYYYPLTSIIIPSGITTIDTYAFYNIQSTSITLPATVTSINDSAFNGCSNLRSFTCLAVTPPTLSSSSAISGIYSSCAIYVPAESVEDYKAATYWSARASYIQAISE